MEVNTLKRNSRTALHRAYEEMLPELLHNNIKINFQTRIASRGRSNVFFEDYITKEKCKRIFRQLINQNKTIKENTFQLLKSRKENKLF